ncbi:hypothetical protein LTR08_007476 [Meristemomyces frigidus]|nr:hypothetical protein LTR08_007476 [Meristemomyces frigidus]
MPPSRSTSRPSTRRSRSIHDAAAPAIGKLDYHPGGRPLHADHAPSRSRSRQSSPHSIAGSFFSDIAAGIARTQRLRINKQVRRYVAFAWAIVNALCAGTMTAYSLYAPLFQKRLGYTQLQVNGVSIAAELAMYLPVPLFGLLCDRTGPGIPSLLAGLLFGFGYLLAAFTYKSGAPASAGGDGWPYWVMVVAFVPIGWATSCMYLSAVTTCAKNFGRGRYKGLALALPIASFGLSGMWESQVGSNLLYERLPGGGKGDVDVYRFFVFLACLLLGTGTVGFFALRIVDEEEMIDDAVDELEASGMLEDSAFFQRQPLITTNSHSAVDQHGYGTSATDGDDDLSSSEIDDLDASADEHKTRLASQEQSRKKAWLLNEETRRFLADHTMWWLAAGFFLVTGPGEAFVNNLGTIIGTLYPPTTAAGDGESGTTPMTTAATHVSIVAITSTLARLLIGTLTDLLAPTTPPHPPRGRSSLANSTTSLSEPPPIPKASRRPEVSRVTFLLTLSLFTSLAQALLASGLLQGHGNLFWLVSAPIGAGYGAVFSLTPIIISVVWGLENFGTNWGIVATASALGATLWGLIYSGVYQWAADRGPRSPGSVFGVRSHSTLAAAGVAQEHKADVLCYGVLCYAPTFWAMAVSVWIACGFWLWAWRGKDGWRQRGITV